MKLINKAAAAAAAVAYAAQVYGVTPPFCPESQVCFRWGVPEVAASSGSGNVYFQLRAPSSFQWVGLGIGSQMSGADMFLMYAHGNNVTLSTRRGTGHVMPQYVPRDDVNLVEGSGISRGQMTANVRCSGCSNLDLSGSTGWIAAWKQGSPAEPISFHDGFNVFSVNLAGARVSSDENPFLAPQDAAGGNGGVVTEADSTSSQTLANAHGILMTVIFLVGFPIGSMLMPVVGNWIVHASWQILMFLGMWAGFGIGYVIAHRAGAFFSSTHTQLGTFVCSLLGLQPILGWLHHLHYVKHKRRGFVSHIHIWYGRALMIIGIVNGGLGLQLAESPRRFVIAYCIVAGLVALMYPSAVLFGLLRKRRNERGSLHTSGVATPKVQGRFV